MLQDLLAGKDRITFDGVVNFQGGSPSIKCPSEAHCSQGLVDCDYLADWAIHEDITPGEIQDCPLNAIIINNEHGEIHAIIVE